MFQPSGHGLWTYHGRVYSQYPPFSMGQCPPLPLFSLGNVSRIIIISGTALHHLIRKRCPEGLPQSLGVPHDIPEAGERAELQRGLRMQLVEILVQMWGTVWNTMGLQGQMWGTVWNTTGLQGGDSGGEPGLPSP